MALDQISFSAGLKTNYPDWKIEAKVYMNNPLLALITKDETFGGDQMKCPLAYANPQARSNTFATANGLSTNSKLTAFFLTRKSDYSVAEIQNETILASEGDSNAFLRAATFEIDGALNSLSRSTAMKLYRSGSGSIGQLASTSGTGVTLTLIDPVQAVNFEVGMYLESSSTDGGGTLNSSTGSQGLITALNRDTGVITLSAAIPALAISDYIFIRGDFGNAFSGLDAWLPFDNRPARLSAPFFGVTRNVDAYRLGGLTQDGSAKPIEEALIDGINLVAREGGRPDYVFMSYSDYANLAKAIGTRVQYVDVKAGTDGAISFQGLSINGPTGVVKCIPDVNCQKGRCWILTMNTWKLYSLKKIVNLFDTDGLRMLRSGTNDSLQIRCFQYAQLGCSAPGYNMQLKLA